MSVNNWINYNYSGWKAKFASETDKMVHYWTKRLVSGENPGDPMVPVDCCVGAFIKPDLTIHCMEILKDTDPGTDYDDFKTTYIDTEVSTECVNSLDGESKMYELIGA